MLLKARCHFPCNGITQVSVSCPTQAPPASPPCPNSAGSDTMPSAEASCHPRCQHQRPASVTQSKKEVIRAWRGLEQVQKKPLIKVSIKSITAWSVKRRWFLCVVVTVWECWLSSGRFWSESWLETSYTESQLKRKTSVLRTHTR